MTEHSIEEIRHAYIRACERFEGYYIKEMPLPEDLEILGNMVDVLLAHNSELEALRAQVAAYEALFAYMHDKHPEVFDNLSQDIKSDVESIRSVILGTHL